MPQRKGPSTNKQDKKDFREWRQYERARGPGGTRATDMEHEGETNTIRRTALYDRYKRDFIGRDEVGEPMYRTAGREADRQLREMGVTPTNIPSRTTRTPTRTPKRKLPSRRMR